MAMQSETQQGRPVLQSFSSEAEAETAIRALRDAGFGADAISVIAREQGRAREVADDTGADTGKGAGIGAATGAGLGALGGLLLGATALTIPGVGILVAGPLAAILGGAGVGAVTGGLAGALAAAGVSDDEARHYEERVQAGDLVVAVAAGDREAEARRILHGAGYGRAGTTEVGSAEPPRGSTVIVTPEENR